MHSGKQLEVILPIVHIGYVNDLLGAIECSKVRPWRIILIDNLLDNRLPYIYPTNILNIRYVKNYPPKSCNESWNQGIGLLDERTTHVSILNDDIMICNEFFHRILDSADLIYNCGVVCPNTILERSRLVQSPYSRSALVPMRRREGWAFTIRREVLDLVPTIPTEKMKNFCGDDWIWLWTLKNGFRWYKNMSISIWHAVGSSIAKAGVRPTMNAEKKAFAAERSKIQ